MKKYVVICRYYATAEFEVLANSEKEANEKADQVELSPDDFFFDFIDSEISEAEEVPELSGMIERAGEILDRFSKEKDDEVYTVPAYRYYQYLGRTGDKKGTESYRGFLLG